MILKNSKLLIGNLEILEFKKVEFQILEIQQSWKSIFRIQESWISNIKSWNGKCMTPNDID
jgi:hypothetical protein